MLDLLEKEVLEKIEIQEEKSKKKYSLWTKEEKKEFLTPMIIEYLNVLILNRDLMNPNFSHFDKKEDRVGQSSKEKKLHFSQNPLEKKQTTAI